MRNGKNWKKLNKKFLNHFPVFKNFVSKFEPPPPMNCGTKKRNYFFVKFGLDFVQICLEKLMKNFNTLTL